MAKTDVVTPDASRTWRRNTDLPFQRFEEDTIIVDPKRREVHLLNETAARVWELLEAPRTLEEIVAALAGEYDVPYDQLYGSVADLLADLPESTFSSSREAVMPPRSPTTRPPSHPDKPWVPPRMKSGRLFESNSLACNKLPSAEPNCQDMPPTASS
jgi:hypothetical protein